MLVLHRKGIKSLCLPCHGKIIDSEVGSKPDFLNFCDFRDPANRRANLGFQYFKCHLTKKGSLLSLKPKNTCATAQFRKKTFLKFQKNSNFKFEISIENFKKKKKTGRVKKNFFVIFLSEGVYPSKNSFWAKSKRSCPGDCLTLTESGS